jgi:hypothetical protein
MCTIWFLSYIRADLSKDDLFWGHYWVFLTWISNVRLLKLILCVGPHLSTWIFFNNKLIWVDFLCGYGTEKWFDKRTLVWVLICVVIYLKIMVGC